MFTTLSCVHIDNSGYTSFSIDESDHYYSMHAHFSESKTRDVDEYMDRRIGDGSDMSFINSRIDGKIAFNDHTTFYIKKYPGLVELKLDKNENSNEAYRRVRAMCEGIKKLITK